MVRVQDIFALLLLVLSLQVVHGQGIKGFVTDENGAPLPYTSIYVKEKGTGTTSNSEGRYELRLPPGEYQVAFQFVGYASEVRQVEVAKGFTILHLSLKPQSQFLKEVSVVSTAEDPAFSIMRKAIAKAPYHMVQCDTYSAEVYMKGTGQLKKIPGLFRKMAAEEGVDTSRVFTSESVSEVYFERPNIFKEKVISVHTSGEDLSGANPNSYINTSFYLPRVVESVSPFSPRAFSYYQFRYAGNFEDRGHKIHKIWVKPRSAGEKVFEGTVYIRDEYWNIHSLDLRTKVEFFDLHLVQFFAPVVDEIWMPVTQKYQFSGSIFGFAGEYHYLASVSNYQITKNEELGEHLALVDEKIEEPPREIKAIEKGEVQEGVKEVFKKNKEVSRKQFRKLMKEYEKEELEETGNEDIISDKTYEVDSAAPRRDPLYWAGIRPVPLTPREVESYEKDDSTYVAEKQDSSAHKAQNKFSPGDIFFGDRYQLGKRSSLNFPGLLPHFRFNTVEGFNLDATAELSIFTNAVYRFEPTLRYGFASNRWYGKLATARESGPREQRTTWNLEGGRFIRQFHPEAIHPFINSVYSLFLERNYMKLYERDFLKLGYSRDFRYRFVLGASAEWASRSALANHTDFSVFDREGIAYGSNAPLNTENPPLGFDNSRALKTSVELRWKPWLKYRKRNGMLFPVENTSPEFRLTYNSGWDGLLGSEVDYQQVELGLKTTIDIGVRAKFDIDLAGGSFLRNENLLFTDYKHFDGGLTELAPLSLTGNYRALDYYRYSTDDSYISALSHIRFRKLLFTHIPIVRLTGIKESFFVNYLKTSHSPHYSEIGYSIDNIFRILRVEFVQSFTGTNPQTFGIRVGVASLNGISFGGR